MKRLAICLFLLTLSLFWASSTGLSETVPIERRGETRVSIDLKDASIKDVLKIFSQQAGMNFVASEEIEDKTLTLYLDHVTVQDALNNIMTANHVEYIQIPGSDIFLVRPAKVEEAPDLLMKVYRLKYARVSDSPLEAAAANATFQATVRSAGISAPSAVVGGYTGRGAAGVAGGGGATAGRRGINLVISNLLSVQGMLVTDPRTNSLIITDVPGRFKFIEEALAKLDRPVSQVMIEAEILETSVNALDSMGLEWGDSKGKIAKFKGPQRSTRYPLKKLSEGLPTASFTVGTFSLAEMDVILELLKSKTDTKVLSRPRIMTLDNEGALINITSETALASITTSTTVEGTALSEVGRAERRTTGISLRVTPQINEDHFVTMTLEPTVVRVEKSEFFAEKFVDPQERSAQTTVMVRDGETIVIGGLVSTDTKDTERKTPILGDIPLLGLLFRSIEKTELDRELLVFVTPHIIKASDIPFVTKVPVTPTTPVTITVPEEAREQLPPRSKEREIEEVLNRFSVVP